MAMLRVAVIDDDQDLQDLFKVALADIDWAVVPCSDAATASEAVKNGDPDVIILDLWLETPATGWELLQRFREDEATRSIPVIVCSGAADHLADREDWLQEQKILMLPKPFELDDLYGSMEAALGARSYVLLENRKRR